MFKYVKNRNLCIYMGWKFIIIAEQISSNAKKKFESKENQRKPIPSILPLPFIRHVSYTYNNDRTSPLYDAIGIIRAIGMRC